MQSSVSVRSDRDILGPPLEVIYEALLGVLGIRDNRKNNYGDKG